MRSVLLFLMFPSMAGAATVCPTGTFDVAGEPLICDYADLQTAVDSANGAPLTAYGTFLSGAAITGETTLVGAASQGLANPVLVSTLAVNCGCTATVDHFVFDNSGSAPLLDVSRGTLTVQNSTLTDATRGRGVAGSGATVGDTLVLEDTHIEGLSAGDTGSPIEVTRGALTLRRVTSASTNGLNGGLVNADSSTLVVDDSVLTTGSAARGGLLYLNGVNASIYGNSVLRDSAAVTQGGLVYATGTQFTLVDSTFDSGSSGGDGGAIAHLNGTGTTTIQRCRFTSNSATNGSAAMYATSTVVDIFDSAFVSNRALGGTGTGGGALVTNTVGGDWERNLFAKNSAHNGGALNAAGAATLYLSDNVFWQNQAANAGGAAVLSQELGALLSTNLFVDNEAVQGGALHIDAALSSTTLSDGNLYCKNAASTRGGALYVQGADGTLDFSREVFVENTSPEGGVVSSWFSALPVFDHVTMLGNGSTTTAGGGGSLYATQSTVITLNNSIVAHTVAGDGAATGTGGIDINYSAFGSNTPQDWNSTNITAVSTLTNANLDFVSFTLNGDCSDDDWTLDPNSPVVGIDEDGNSPGAAGGAFPIVPADLPAFPVDSDNDGWPDEADCAPNDSTAFPGGTEVCDGGVDNDCDGLADDDDLEGALGMVSGVTDSDGDGFTAPGGGLTCSSATGTPGDCDDDDANNYPGNAEVCDGRDNDCDGAVDMDDAGITDANTFYEDADNDYHGDPARPVYTCDMVSVLPSVGDDCDDDDPANYPGNDETCDGQDNDCDDLIDTADSGLVGGNVYYLDSDGDGHTDPNSPVATCDMTVPVEPDDCDDTDPLNFPGNVEACDGQDNDCDGLIDDADTVVSDATEWHLDTDGDGYAGEGAQSKMACVGGDGWTAFLGDCEPEVAAVHPGADETCDSWDEDCDGSVDEDAVDATRYFTDADSDGYGDDSTGELSCADLGLVTVGGDCDDTEAGVNPAATEIADNGVDDDCDGSDLTDLDGDGFSVPEDCNDDDAAIHPLATDVPDDGIDQDCSGNETHSYVGASSCSSAPGALWLGLWAIPVLRRRREPAP
ncbi:MAG: putative metal-binding motif-containing protein [Proteobacteria bacterium]|nr:putative metal-binding motif-containing protein [Pseudomonadota bacterium]